MRRGLEQLFSRHHRAFYAVALAITRNREAAEDAVHDALVAVAETRSKPRDLKAYLFRAVRNKALHYRGCPGGPRRGDGEADYLADESGNGEDAVFATQVMHQLESLSIDERTVIILKLFAGLTFVEIGEFTGNSSNTIASWYRRGLQKLKEAFDGRS